MHTPGVPKVLPVVELWDEISSYLIPSTTPLFSPNKPSRLPRSTQTRGGKGTFQALARTSRFFNALVMREAFKHVVIASEGAVLGIITAWSRKEALFDNTERCDIQGDFTEYSEELWAFVSSLGKLKVLVWDFVPRSVVKALHLPERTACLLVEDLAMSSVPDRFTHADVVALSGAFPKLERLLLEELPVINLYGPPPPNPVHVFPNLRRLEVGSRVEFMPGDKGEPCRLLELMTAFGDATVLPKLGELWVRGMVLGVTPFLRKHGGLIHTLSLSVRDGDLRSLAEMGDVCRQLDTLVTVVGSKIRFPNAISNTVRRIVVCDPLLPWWRHVPTMKFKMKEHVKAIISSDLLAVQQVEIDDTGIMDEGWWVDVSDALSTSAATLTRSKLAPL